MVNMQLSPYWFDIYNMFLSQWRILFHEKAKEERFNREKPDFTCLLFQSVGHRVSLITRVRTWFFILLVCSTSETAIFMWLLLKVMTMMSLFLILVTFFGCFSCVNISFTQFNLVSQAMYFSSMVQNCAWFLVIELVLQGYHARRFTIMLSRKLAYHLS